MRATDCGGFCVCSSVHFSHCLNKLMVSRILNYLSAFNERFYCIYQIGLHIRLHLVYVITTIPGRSYSLKHRHFSKIAHISTHTAAIIRYALIHFWRKNYDRRFLAKKRRYYRLYLRKKRC